LSEVTAPSASFRVMTAPSASRPELTALGAIRLLVIDSSAILAFVTAPSASFPVWIVCEAIFGLVTAWFWMSSVEIVLAPPGWVA
jgi:hypothetical protein